MLRASLLSTISLGTIFFGWVSFKAMYHNIQVDCTIGFSFISMTFFLSTIAIRAMPNLSSVHAKRFGALCGTEPISQTSGGKVVWDIRDYLLFDVPKSFINPPPKFTKVTIHPVEREEDVPHPGSHFLGVFQ